MRTLEKNKTSIWLVNKLEDAKVYDSYGNFTGEYTQTYSNPIYVKIQMYPASGIILEQTFGKDVTLDLISTCIEVNMSKDSLLFLSEPDSSSDYKQIYDYRVEAILPSINSTTYGLKRRT